MQQFIHTRGAALGGHEVGGTKWARKPAETYMPVKLQLTFFIVVAGGK